MFIVRVLFIFMKYKVNIQICIRNMKGQTGVLLHSHLLHHCCSCKRKNKMEVMKKPLGKIDKFGRVRMKILFIIELPLSSVQVVIWGGGGGGGRLLHNKIYQPFAIRMKGNAIDWSKMTFNTTYLFFKDHVEESGIKLSYPCRCSCDIHSLLTTAKNYLSF